MGRVSFTFFALLFTISFKFPKLFALKAQLKLFITEHFQLNCFNLLFLIHLQYESISSLHELQIYWFVTLTSSGYRILRFQFYSWFWILTVCNWNEQYYIRNAFILVLMKRIVVTRQYMKTYVNARNPLRCVECVICKLNDLGKIALVDWTSLAEALLHLFSLKCYLRFSKQIEMWRKMQTKSIPIS